MRSREDSLLADVFTKSSPMSNRRGDGACVQMDIYNYKAYS